MLPRTFWIDKLYKIWERWQTSYSPVVVGSTFIGIGVGILIDRLILSQKLSDFGLVAFYIGFGLFMVRRAGKWLYIPKGKQ